MELDTAVRVWRELEKPRYMFDDTPFPRFSVRLDAGSGDQNDERDYRIRVVRLAGAPQEESEDDLRFVLDLVQEHGLTIHLQNNGAELT